MARHPEIEKTDAETRAKVFAALSDPTRLRIVELLLDSGSDMCGKAIADTLKISMANLCHHWKVLEEAGLITKQRDGQQKFCSLNKSVLTGSLKSILP